MNPQKSTCTFSFMKSSILLTVLHPKVSYSYYSALQMCVWVWNNDVNISQVLMQQEPSYWRTNPVQIKLKRRKQVLVKLQQRCDVMVEIIGLLHPRLSHRNDSKMTWLSDTCPGEGNPRCDGERKERTSASWKREGNIEVSEKCSL